MELRKKKKEQDVERVMGIGTVFVRKKRRSWGEYEINSMIFSNQNTFYENIRELKNILKGL